MTRSKVRPTRCRVKSLLKCPQKKRSGKRVTTESQDDDKRDDLLQKSDMKNDKFEAYYTKQLALDGDEWCRLVDICREPLPSTFRISGSRECVNSFPFFSQFMDLFGNSTRTAAVLTSVMHKTYVPHLSDVMFEDQLIPPPIPLPW